MAKFCVYFNPIKGFLISFSKFGDLYQSAKSRIWLLQHPLKIQDLSRFSRLIKTFKNVSSNNIRNVLKQSKLAN